MIGNEIMETYPLDISAEQIVQVLIEQWRRHYNAVRPHSSLGYQPPAPEAILPTVSELTYATLRPAQMLAHGVVLPLKTGPN